MLSFFKQFFLYGFTLVISKIIALLLLPFYTNHLTKEDYGVFAVITAFKGIVDILANLNIHSGVAREYYNQNLNKKNLISTGFFSIVCFSLIISVTLTITDFFWLGVLNLEKHSHLFNLMILTIPSGSLFSYLAVITRYKQKPLLYALGALLQLITQLGATIILVFQYRIGVGGILLGIILGDIIGVIYFYFSNKEYICIIFDLPLLRQVLYYSLPTIPAVLADWIDGSVGQLLINKYISLSDSGVYSISLRITSVFLFLQIAFGYVWQPFIFQNLESQDFFSKVEKIFKFTVYCLIFIAVNLSLFSDYIVKILSNNEYIAAADYVIVLSIPMSLAVLLWFSNMGATLSKKTKYMAYSTLSGSVINLLLMLVLIPQIGIISVPLSLTISKLLSFFMSRFYTYKLISLKLAYGEVILLCFCVVSIFLLKKHTFFTEIFWIVVLVFNIFFIFMFYKKITSNLFKVN